jgi:hypothetical protein
MSSLWHLVGAGRHRVNPLMRYFEHRYDVAHVLTRTISPKVPGLNNNCFGNNFFPKNVRSETLAYCDVRSFCT